MTYIFFDCETTGLISFKLPLSDESQPRILSLAAILTDNDGNILESMDTLIHHPGLEIPEFITKINGITQADCEARGCTIDAALHKYNDMKSRSTTRVAHNLSFDKQMIARETLARACLVSCQGARPGASAVSWRIILHGQNV